MTWLARAWTSHAATTVVVDESSVITGVRVIAECETEADARLMAAAPELLSVALMVANIGEYRDLVDKLAEVLRPHEREAFIKLYREDARAAIAKAKATRSTT